MGSVSLQKFRAKLPRRIQSKANGNIPVDFTIEVMRPLIISKAINGYKSYPVRAPRTAHFERRHGHILNFH